MTYDSVGNLLTFDGPLAGTVDTTRYRYDAARQLTGRVGPDPDGGGPLKNRASRTTYNLDGQPTRVEIGTVNSQSDADWTTFGVQQTLDATYDAAGRKVKDASSVFGTPYTVTQYSYDSLDRPDCVAARMNPAAFGALPGSACTVGTAGSYGPDRIGRNTYDAAGQLTKTTVAYGTAEQGDKVSYTYSNNGKLASPKDNENNFTTFEYDGFDRLVRTRFPAVAPGAGVSSTTDYEQSTYDPNGNVKQRQLRDTQTITYTYDNLDRLTLKDLPGSNPDAGFGYDLLGRLTNASNAVGLVWPDGNVTSFAYDATDAMTTIYEGAGTSVWMAAYDYDDLGRRIAQRRRYGATTSYGYDAVSRLASLTHDFAGTAAGAVLKYDPLGRLFEVAASSGTRRFQYDGNRIAAEYDGSNTRLRRYVFGPGVDEPAFGYGGSGLAQPLWQHADERGSVIAQSDASGAAAVINRYDEYGIPGSTNAGLFQYTGQAMIAEIGMYYYKARIYSPTLGRFLQTDPIGYGDGMNLYGYVGGDPVNATDPSGLEDVVPESIVIGQRGPDLGVGPSVGPNFSMTFYQRQMAEGRALYQTFLKALKNVPQPTKRKPQSRLLPAIGRALRIINPRAWQGNNIAHLNANFARLLNPKSFDFRGFSRSTSLHGTSYQAPIPGYSDYSVKVYLEDTDNGGLATITITTTLSFDNLSSSFAHIENVIPYEMGYPVNEFTASQFCNQAGC